MQTIHELCNKLLLSQSESFRNQKSKKFFPNNCSFKALKGTLLHNVCQLYDKFPFCLLVNVLFQPSNTI